MTASAAGKTLSEFTNDELAEEIGKRAGLVASIWNAEDVTSLIDEDEDLEHLGDEERAALATAFLSHVSRGLQDHLGARGNEYTSMLWGSDRDVVMSEIGLSPKRTL